MSDKDYWDQSSEFDENNSINGEYTPEESEEDEDIPNESRYLAYERNEPFSPQFTSPVIRRMRRESPSKRSIRSRYPNAALFSPTPPIRIPLEHAFLDAETLQRLTQPKPKATKVPKQTASNIPSPILERTPIPKPNNTRKRKSPSPSNSSDELSPIIKKRVEATSPVILPVRKPVVRLPMSPPSHLEVPQQKSRLDATPAPSAPKPDNPTRPSASMDIAQRIALLKAGAMKSMDASRSSENRQNTSGRI